MKRVSAILAGLAIGLWPPSLAAQLRAAKDGPVVYGHHHLNATSTEAHKKFWVETLGGGLTKAGTAPAEVIKFPNVLIFMNQRSPSGGTKGTTVNHIGFQVPNIRAIVDRVRTAGYPIITRAELPVRFDVKDDLGFIPDLNTNVAFVMGPDETKVEFVEVQSMKEPIALHHVHYYGPNPDEMQAWYVKVFGAQAGKRGAFVAADLPGVNLTYSPAPDPVVGTRGRAIDHVGFEIRNLEQFCRELEGKGVKLDRGYVKVPAYDIAVAFLTDPWGTYIELTEGLDKVP